MQKVRAVSLRSACIMLARPVRLLACAAAASAGRVSRAAGRSAEYSAHHTGRRTGEREADGGGVGHRRRDDPRRFRRGCRRQVLTATCNRRVVGCVAVLVARGGEIARAEGMDEAYMRIRPTYALTMTHPSVS
eukprot:7386308-Prymnesium_polylepis.1